MAPICGKVNTFGPDRFNMGLCCVLVCCVGVFTTSVAASTTTTPTSSTTSETSITTTKPLIFPDACQLNLTLQAATSQPYPQDLLQLPHQTNVTFHVNSCSDVYIILYVMEFNPEPTASFIRVVIGENNQSSSIQHCSSSCIGFGGSSENPLECGKFKQFAISWESGLDVFMEKDGHWEEFMVFLPQTIVGRKVYAVFIGYKLSDGSNGTDSEWILNGHCVEKAENTSLVTQGHMVGAAIAALLVGIIFGAVCVIFIPKLIAYIRGARETNTKEGMPTEEELTTLVGVQTSSPVNKSQGLTSIKPSTEIQTSKLNLTLPGDDPPPRESQSASRAANKYHSYLDMGSGSPSKPDDGARRASDASKSDSGRVASPLPALPGDEEMVTSDDLYVNADAHIYSGIHHDSPIYENRNMDMYEPLKPSS